MEKTLYYLLAFAIGVTLALHLAMNADVGKKIENVRAANAVFWAIGALVALSIWLASPNRSAISRLGEVNPALLLAGLLGASLVLGIAILIPRIGAGPTNVISLSGQVIMGMLISHFGILSSTHQPITPLKILGIAIMLGGAVMAVLL
jgi:transporter family-2 protein